MKQNIHYLMLILVVVLSVAQRNNARGQTAYASFAQHTAAQTTPQPLYLPLVSGGPAQMPTAEPTPTPTPDPTATAEPANASIAASIGITATQLFQENGTISGGPQVDTVRLRLFAVQAIFVASRLVNSGQTVTTGTLTIVNANEATYDPTPNDRLHVKLPDGRTVDVTVTTVTGTNGSSPEGYLGNAHQFDARIVTGPPVAAPDPAAPLPTNTDVQLTSSLANGPYTITVNGQMDIDGQSNTVNLTAQGTEFFDSSSGSFHRISDYTVVGTVNNATLALTVDERYRAEIIGDSRVTVSTADTEVRNQWTYDGVTYQVQNGLIRRSFQNGYVNESEIDSYWQASGQLLRDGQVVGALGLNLNALYMEVFVTADGEARLLQRFRRETTIKP